MQTPRKPCVSADNSILEIATMDFRFVETNRNRKKLYCGGFFYTKDKRTDSAEYWKCDQWVNKSKGRATINSDGGITLNGVHNHEGNPAKLEVAEAVSTIKKRALSERDAPRAIISRAVSSVDLTRLALT